VAKKFIEMHKGEIWAESEGREKGSTFFIRLPISEEILLGEFLQRI
jgi:signal transduction histidine kinase